MALTKAQVREILSAAGVEADKISEAVSKIIDGHTASIEALREERDNLKVEAAKVATLEKENADLKDKVSGYEGKDYDALKKEYEEYKTSVANKEARAKKEAAYTKVLRDAGINERHFAKIIKYSDVDGLELDDEGKLTNAKDVLKTVKQEWSDHIESVSVSGAKSTNPPAEGGDDSKKYDTSNAEKRVAQYVADRYGAPKAKED